MYELLDYTSFITLLNSRVLNLSPVLGIWRELCPINDESFLQNEHYSTWTFFLQERTGKWAYTYAWLIGYVILENIVWRNVLLLPGPHMNSINCVLWSPFVQLVGCLKTNWESRPKFNALSCIEQETQGELLAILF